MIWRGVNLDLRNSYPKNRKITWWPVTSCTASINILDTPQYLDQNRSRTLFSIETHAGRSIRNHSCYPDEEEILLSPGRAFHVVGQLMHGKNAFIIHLKDSKPPFVTLVKPISTRHEHPSPGYERDFDDQARFGILAERLRRRVEQDRGKQKCQELLPFQIVYLILRSITKFAIFSSTFRKSESMLLYEIFFYHQS